MQIRQFWQSSIWRYLTIRCEVSSLIKSVSYTSLVFSLLYYIASKCSFTTKLHYLTHWQSWEKCREEQPFGFLECFEHLHHSVLRLSQALSLFTFILRNLAADLNWELTLFQTTTSFDYYWNQGLILISQVILIAFPIRNRPATEPVTLKVHNIKLSFDIWLVLYMYFILYFWHFP